MFSDISSGQTLEVSLEIQQALTGLQLSESDESLLRYLHFFFQKIPGKANHFVHVLPDVPMRQTWLGTAPTPLAPDTQMHEALLAQMKKQVDKNLKAPEGMTVDYALELGDPLEQLLALAESLSIDLLVIGQHRGTENHEILAKNLVRKSPAKVLVVPEGSRSRMQTLLVPFDFSPLATRALATAIELHRKYVPESRLLCQYVYTLPAINMSKVGQTFATYKGIVEHNISKSFWALISQLAPDYQQKIEWHLVERDQQRNSEVIWQLARKEGVDLMLLGAKGHSKVHRLLMGSVTERLLDTQEQIPILVIK